MFTQQYIESVEPIRFSGSAAILEWTAVPGAPAGLAWQVYLDRSLAWHGYATRVQLPWPQGYVEVDIGSVDPADIAKSAADELPVRPAVRCTLAWQGGTFQDPLGTVAGFRVYGEVQPGGGVDYATVLADIPAYVGGIVTDGWGNGGFGSGGFGEAAGNYSFESGPLSSGTWTFAVVTYNSSNDESPPDTVPCTIVAPPLPPAPFAGTMDRLHYTVAGFGGPGFGSGGFGMPEINLTWNPSPSA